MTDETSMFPVEGMTPEQPVRRKRGRPRKHPVAASTVRPAPVPVQAQEVVPTGLQGLLRELARGVIGTLDRLGEAERQALTRKLNLGHETTVAQIVAGLRALVAVLDQG
jgi:hypothetical protein